MAPWNAVDIHARRTPSLTSSSVTSVAAESAAPTTEAAMSRKSMARSSVVDVAFTPPGLGRSSLSHRERGTMQRSAFPGSSSQIEERGRAGSTAGTTAELVPAARPRLRRISTAPAQERDRVAAGTRPRCWRTSTNLNPGRKVKIGAASGRIVRRGMRSAQTVRLPH